MWMHSYIYDIQIKYINLCVCVCVCVCVYQSYDSTDTVISAFFVFSLLIVQDVFFFFLFLSSFVLGVGTWTEVYACD